MSAAPFRVVVLMPVYRDWDCAALVCRDLDTRLRALEGVDARIILVDDGSPDGLSGWPADSGGIATRIDALRLFRNLGHQRAICAGVCHVYEHIPCDAVLVMDSDGEDQPADAVRLIELAQADASRVIFAERRKRQEGLVFRTGYGLFRAVHRMLTGIPVRVGNFSVAPLAVVRRLVFMPELWNHFAGAIYKSKARFECVPMDRGKRLRGKSHMDLAALAAHGFAGIATFQEIVATRILIANVLATTLLFAVLCVLIALRLMYPRAVSNWAALAAAMVLVVGIQLVAMSFTLVFTLISNRTNRGFIPQADYAVFVDRLERLAGGE